MALSETDRHRCHARIMRDALWRAWPPTITKADIRAAVDAVDDWADGNATQYNASLPITYRTAADSAQKALLLAAVLMRRAGRFDAEEDG